MSNPHIPMSRRYLPSTSALMALEALDRLGSASAAARELALTQGAVSRQVQALEAQLEIRLFKRERKRLVASAAARDYAGQIRLALAQIAQATQRLRTDADGSSLSLAILPAFGMHWLAPRLGAFAARHPEIALNLSTRLAPVDFRAEPFDAAIHFGRPQGSDVDCLPLIRERLLPVAAPALVGDRVRRAGDVATLPLLHLATRERAWSRWFRQNGVDGPAPRFMMFDQFATMAQAAIHGLGVALLPDFMIGQDIAEGRLVIVHGDGIESTGQYFLVCPRDRAARPPLVAFRAWLAATAPLPAKDSV